MPFELYSFLLNFIQVHIIACLPYKINPLFQKNLPFFSVHSPLRPAIPDPQPKSKPQEVFCGIPQTFSTENFPQSPSAHAFLRTLVFLRKTPFPLSLSGYLFVKPRFFVQFLRCGKIHSVRKSGKSGEGCRDCLCEPKMHIHNSPHLWKTPVDNTVENVENCELSTGISLLSKSCLSCGKVCIPLCIFSPKVAEFPCYVTALHKPHSVQSFRKSLQFVNRGCHFLFPPQRP